MATDRYVPVLRRHRAANVVGVFDRNIERASPLAQRCGAKAFDSVEELCDADIDVAFVCTAPFSHSELVSRALERSVSVLVEKPMALSVGECEAMVSAAKAAGVKLGVSHNFLFSRSMRRVERWMEQGRLGRVQHVAGLQSSSPSRRLPDWYEELPGGLFFDEAPHMLYLMQALMGELKLVDARATPGPSGDVRVGTFGQLDATFENTSGLVGRLTMLFGAPVSEWNLVVVGARAVAAIDVFRDIAILIPSDGSHKPIDILRTSSRMIIGHARGVISTGSRFIARRQFWGHERLIDEFLSAVEEDIDPPVTGEDGLRIVELMSELLKRVGSQ